jgi:hypothetical protein
MAVNEYCVVYEALCCLRALLGKSAWKKVFLLLKNDDICNLSEGKQEISWIWRTIAINQGDKPYEEHFHEGLGISWLIILFLMTLTCFSCWPTLGMCI